MDARAAMRGCTYFHCVLSLPDVEPPVLAWEAPAVQEVAKQLHELGDASRRRVVVAVDGRSASGKSTFARRLGASVPGSSVVCTDDVAWWESFFDWEHLLVEGVLEPLRRGDGVSYRPPAWDRRARSGAIEVASDASFVVIEGVGVGRRSLSEWFDAMVWVQSDLVEARRRGIERDGATPEAEAFWEEWNREEVEFLADDRPWERATLTVCGTPELTRGRHDPLSEVLVNATTPSQQLA